MSLEKFEKDEFLVSSKSDVLARCYRNPLVRELVSDLESRFNYADATHQYKNLVNFSTHQNHPYMNWVRYREGYAIELVKDLIGKASISPDSYFVADPMVGSGTSQLAAAELGFDSLGMDVNPYSQYLLETKFLRPSTDVLNGVRIFSSMIAEGVPSNYSFDMDEISFSDYFSVSNLREMMYLKEKIEELSDDRIKRICNTAWLVIIEDTSDRKKDGNGLSSRPSRVKNVVSYYLEKLDSIVADYSHSPLPAHISFDFVLGSAKGLNNAADMYSKKIGKKLGAIIFSPPYANSFDYFESYKMELLFGNLCKKDEFSDLRAGAIRSYRKGYGANLVSEYEIVNLIGAEVRSGVTSKEKASGKVDQRTRMVPNMLTAYFEDMKSVLQSSFESLSVNGSCFIVVDQSSYVGVIVPTDLILAQIAESIGFEVKSITKCRNAMTSSQQMQQYEYLQANLRESIVELIKPAQA